MNRSNDIHEFMSADTGAINDFKIGNSTNKNINLSRLSKFIDDLSRDKEIRLASIAVLSHGKLVAEHYVEPYCREYRHVSYSMCKSVTQMAVGIAVSEGLLDVNEHICDIFPEYKIPFFHKQMKDVTIKHLLTMSSGVKFDEVSSFLTEDWCKAFLSSELLFDPDTEFCYNSLNTYMLAAIVAKRANSSVMEYLQTRLFDPLHITDITWDLCPQGIERGGWGMKLSLLDMLKLGQLYLNQGAYEVHGVKKQILSKEWVEESCKCHKRLEGFKQIKGYGYQIWLLSDGAYLFNGLFGQNVYIHPAKKLVIACMAGGYEIFPEGTLIEKISDFVANEENFTAHVVKEVTSNALKKLSDILIYKKKLSLEYSLDQIAPYLNQTYTLKGHASSLLPITSQIIYTNYMSGITKFRLSVKQGKLYMNVLDSKERFTLQIGYGKVEPYVYQILSFKGKEMPVAVRGSVRKNASGGNVFVLKLVYLEETIDKRFEIQFVNNQVEIKAMDVPNMSKFMHKLSDEPLLKRGKKLKMLDKNEMFESFLDKKLQQILAPECVGTIVIDNEQTEV